MRQIALDEPNAVSSVADALRRGVVALPTDTLYGFSSSLANADVHDRIAVLKQDTGDKRYLCLASSLHMVEDYIVSWGCASREVLASVWPAPLTAVFEARKNRCPAWVGDTIALRVPDVPEIRVIIELVGGPVISTSINVSGEAPLNDAAEIAAVFGEKIDAIVLSRHTADPAVSTLVDFTGESPRVLRRGSYDWEGG